MFSLKASRFATNRKVLADAGETVERFYGSGALELKDKLGPINWQLMATKKFDPIDFEVFLKLLPASVEGRAIRPVVEVRHDSFSTQDFTAIAKAHGVAVVVASDSDFPQIVDPTAPSSMFASWKRGRANPSDISRPISTFGRRAQILGPQAEILRASITSAVEQLNRQRPEPSIST